MRAWLATIGLILLLAAGCAPANVGNGTGGPLPEHPTWYAVHATTPTGMTGGQSADWHAEVTGTESPVVIRWEFGGGADPNFVELAVDTLNPIVTVRMLNPSQTEPAHYTGRVTVLNNEGYRVYDDFTYTVAVTQGVPPVIDSVEVTGNTLTVTAHDADGDNLTCNITAPSGLIPSAMSQAMPDGTATFTFTTDNFVAGSGGVVSISVFDGIFSSKMEHVSIVIKPFAPEPDTLYLLTQDRVVTVVTGALSHPFQYLNSVSITVERDAEYAAGTFNPGSAGGTLEDIDGAWNMMKPFDGFLLPPDNFIQHYQIGGGRHRFSFSITPVNGNDVFDFSGALFNFELEGDPGTYTLGLLQISGIDRTFFTSSASDIRHWTTLMADETGALNIDGVSNTYVIE